MSKVKSPWIVDLKASFQEDYYLNYLVLVLNKNNYKSFIILIKNGPNAINRTAFEIQSNISKNI